MMPPPCHPKVGTCFGIGVLAVDLTSFENTFFCFVARLDFRLQQQRSNTASISSRPRTCLTL
eukprot:451542-Amorphochlora_amoeboformis.AAC.3